MLSTFLAFLIRVKLLSFIELRNAAHYLKGCVFLILCFFALQADRHFAPFFRWRVEISVFFLMLFQFEVFAITRLAMVLLRKDLSLDLIWQDN
jgi:hypothetical protein